MLSDCLRGAMNHFAIKRFVPFHEAVRRNPPRDPPNTQAKNGPMLQGNLRVRATSTFVGLAGVYIPTNVCHSSFLDPCHNNSPSG